MNFHGVLRDMFVKLRAVFLSSSIAGSRLSEGKKGVALILMKTSQFDRIALYAINKSGVPSLIIVVLIYSNGNSHNVFLNRSLKLPH